jgi:hypothetical protein
VVKLSAPVEGVIEAIGADRGQSVQQGLSSPASSRTSRMSAGSGPGSRQQRLWASGSARSRLRFLAAKKDRTEKIRIISP